MSEAIQEGLPEVEPEPRRTALRAPRGVNWVTWACAIVCFSSCVDLMQMFAELDKARAVAGILQGGAGIDRFEEAHRLSTLLGAILIVLFIASAAIVMRWLYLVYRNLHGLQVDGLTYSAVDAIKTFFLPTGWPYMPHRLLQEVWQASDPTLPAGSADWAGQRGSWLIRLWWLLFLGRFIRISISINPFPLHSPALLTVLQIAAWCTAAACAMGVVSGVLFIIIAIRMERRQWARFNRLQW